MGELLSKLQKLYGGKPVKADALGRRMALPKEIQDALEAENAPPEAFYTLLGLYPPTDADLTEKGEEQPHK
jgi:hypothetical protein